MKVFCGNLVYAAFTP
nr:MULTISPECIES: hypothetical protein [Vibrio]